MLPLKRFSLPSPCGEFGAIRKHDIHTGIDLYCNSGVHVYAIEAGIVVANRDFTGVGADSPWWNDTEYLVVSGASGFILYGEISTPLSVGTVVREGEVLGSVVTVLKKNKGKPMTMLHLELYSKFNEPVLWGLGLDKPNELLDITPLITKNLWKYYSKNHRESEVITLQEGEWFNIAGRGTVMTVDMSLVDPSINIQIEDTVVVAGISYSVTGIEMQSRSKKAGLLLKKIDNDESLGE